jgi:hypothetical protein
MLQDQTERRPTRTAQPDACSDGDARGHRDLILGASSIDLDLRGRSRALPSSYMHGNGVNTHAWIGRSVQDEGDRVRRPPRNMTDEKGDRGLLNQLDACPCVHVGPM